jgi:hypothetical protein
MTLLACTPTWDPTLNEGRLALGSEIRRGRALGPGEAVPAEALAVGDPCSSSWSAPGTSRIELDCDQPSWIELPRPAAEGPDLMVIVLDTTRPDHLSAERTPRIHAHAQGAWSAAEVLSPSAWTVPSMVALFTGQQPWELLPEGSSWLSDQALTLPERLPGHKRLLISANPWVGPSSNLDQGFDRVRNVDEDSQAVDLARAWWSEPSAAPRLMVVQLMTAHMPYLPRGEVPGEPGPNVSDSFADLDGWPAWATEADKARIAQLYAAGVAELDPHAGALLDLAGPETVVAIVSDHGEELFEHGGFEHGHALWPEVTRVHAAITGAELPPAPERIGLHQVGQALQQAAGLEVQGSRPLGRRVLLGHPLGPRNPIHRWALLSPAGALYYGAERTLEGDERTLDGQLSQAIEAIAEIVYERHPWCELAVAAGETLRLPSTVGWAEWSPPGSWGPARFEGDEIVLEPVRSGTWWLRDLRPDCELREDAPAQPDLSAQQRLRVLGYLESD